MQVIVPCNNYNTIPPSDIIDNMAKILVLAANPGVLVGGYGGAERSMKLTEALAGHNVVELVLSLDNKNRSVTTQDGIQFISVLEDKNLNNLVLQTARQKFSGNQDVSGFTYSSRYAKFKNELRRQLVDTDLVVLDHYGAAGLIRDVNIDVPIVYASHNCEIDLSRQMFPKNDLAHKYVYEMEKYLLDRSSVITYCSKDDIVKLNSEYPNMKPSFYIANGTDRREGLVRRDNSKSKDIIFIGSGHGPNVDAAKGLIEVARSMPEYTFNIIGKCGESIDSRGLPSNYVVHGFLNERLTDLLFENSVAFINPITSGSGTHLKIMRALSYGLPVISSRVGLRGFSEEEIKDTLLVADTNQEMTDHIRSLSDSTFYKKISDNTLKLADNYYWDVIQKQFRDVCEDLITKEKVVVNEVTDKKRVLIYSIIRNNVNHIDRFYNQIKSVVSENPDFEFCLSLYENDSTDGTKQAIFARDWSFVSGLSITTENINTQLYGSVKDAQRVENLAKARNKALEGGGFLADCDYVLMVEGDNLYTAADVRRLLTFDQKEPDFDIVSAVSIRQNGTHYDWWATRTGPVYKQGVSEVPRNFNSLEYGPYYSTSNGLCLYKADAFKKGARYGWTNKETGTFDCEMVVVCQEFQKLGHDKIFVNYQSKSYH